MVGQVGVAGIPQQRDVHVEHACPEHVAGHVLLYALARGPGGGRLLVCGVVLHAGGLVRYDELLLSAAHAVLIATHVRAWAPAIWGKSEN